MKGCLAPKPKLARIIVILHVGLDLFVVEPEVVIELERWANAVLWC